MNIYKWLLGCVIFGDWGLRIADCGLRIADWGLRIADWGLGSKECCVLSAEGGRKSNKLYSDAYRCLNKIHKKSIVND
jgi:hypothetical protein